MHIINISKEELRKFLITYQGLQGTEAFRGEKGIVDFIRRVGCIQYDPLNIVGRNADLMLQSRIENYDTSMLEKLLYDKRELIDGWDKMMSIYSVEDWPCFERLRASKKVEVERVLQNRNSIEAINYVQVVKEYIQRNGPAQPSKLELGSAQKGGWGHGKLSSAAMDYMWNIGILGVREKKNTQKIYDLVENLLPEEIYEMKDPFQSHDDFYKWYFKRRIGSIGIYWSRNGGGWLGHFLSDKSLRERILEELFEEGELIKIEVEGFKETFYLRNEDLGILNGLNWGGHRKASFLAPLDNLLWDRKLIKDVFSFEYSWEVYKPAAERQYGYYVLPVLYGHELVARFEPELHRGKEPLSIKNWWWEGGCTVTGEVLEAVMEAFKDFCRYLKAEGLSKDSCKKIKVE